MRMVVMLRAETGRGGGLAGALLLLLLLVFGLQHSELRFGALQFDGFLFEPKLEIINVLLRLVQLLVEEDPGPRCLIQPLL